VEERLLNGDDLFAVRGELGNDVRDVLERASARSTTTRVVAGSIARQLLGTCGVRIWSFVDQLGPVRAFPDVDDVLAAIPAGWRQRDLAFQLITAIPGVSCVKPSAALYMFPRLDPKVYPIADDRQFFLELLQETRVMLVQGTGFNWATPDHFRIVFLPHEDDLREAIGRIARFLESYRKRTTI